MTGGVELADKVSAIYGEEPDEQAKKELEKRNDAEKDAFEQALEKKVEEEENLRAIIKDMIIQSLPVSTVVDTEDLEDRGAALPLGVAYLATYFALLLYFLISGTKSEYAKKFLSVEAPGKLEATCIPVTIPVTGDFQADKDGRWNTNPDFGIPIYDFAYAGTNITTEQYPWIMSNFSAALKSYSAQFNSLDFISAAVAWNYWKSKSKFASIEAQTQTQISSIFSGMYSWDAILSSKGGSCRNSYLGLEMAYSTSSMVLDLKFKNQQKNAANPADGFCPAQVTLDYYYGALGFYPPSPDSSPDYYQTSLDMRSAAAAFAVNTGIIDPNALLVSSGIRFFEDYKGYVFIDSKTPDMDEIICFPTRSDVSAQACFIQMGKSDALAFPVLTSTTKGGDYSSPRRACTCPTDVIEYNCNSGQELQLTLLFSGDGSDVETIALGYELLQQGQASVRTIISSLGYASFNNIVSSTPLQSNFIDVLSSLGPSASLLTVDLYTPGTKLNVDGASLGMFSNHLINATFSSSRPIPPTTKSVCTNTLYQAKALAKLALTPPVPIVQPFLSCHATQANAFVTAAGIAAGNASLATSIFVTIGLFLISEYNNRYKERKMIPPERRKKFATLFAKKKRDELELKITRLRRELHLPEDSGRPSELTDNPLLQPGRKSVSV